MKKYMGILLLLIVASCLFVSAKPCLAASAKVDITANNSEVTVGDTVYVYIKISSATAFGDFEANLTYDSDVLKYKSGTSVISGGNGYLRISDMNNGSLDTKRKYALEFETRKTGESQLVFDDGVMVYDESGMEMPVSSNSLTIKVKPNKTASTNASLKSLVTDPKDLIPNFDKNVFDYKINVSHDTQRLIINAIPEDNKAKVKVSGNDSLQDGENKIVITVLAESGDVIEYTINAFREALPTVTVIPTVTPVITDVTNMVFQKDGETYIINGGTYHVIEPSTDIAIPKGYTKTETELSITSITVPAYALASDPSSDFVLIYAENETGDAGFYRYDKVENTLQRYVEIATTSDQKQSNINTTAMVIAILSSVCLVLVIVIIWLSIRLKRYRNE